MSQIALVCISKKNISPRDYRALHRGLLSVSSLRHGYVNARRNIVGSLRQTVNPNVSRSLQHYLRNYSYLQVSILVYVI